MTNATAPEVTITYVDRPVLGDGYAWDVVSGDAHRSGICHSREDAETMAANAVEALTAPKGIVTEILDAQNDDNGGVLQPGQEGFWKIWGASARDVEAGDLIMVRWEAKDGSHELKEHALQARLPEGDGIAPKFQAESGEIFRLGMLQKIVLLRWGTGNTLSRHCR
jgi:hypothetical protein